MGAVPTILRTAVDTWVNSVAPTRNYNSGTASNRFHVETASGARGNSEGLLFFGLPFPRGVQIISAKLKIYQYNTTPSSRTVSLSRASKAWAVSKVNWASRPASVGATVNCSQAGGKGPGTQWEFDVTALMQTVSNGGTWYGFRLWSANAIPAIGFHSSTSSSVGYRPVLEISWKDNPLPPSVLHPSDDRAVSPGKPVLQWDFTDFSGDVSMQALQVRLFTTEANALANTSPEWDSGELASAVPELDLSTTAYPAIASASRRWWRVRVKDGAGLWSGWSDAESFYVQSKGVLTLNNPPTSGAISEATPPVDWSFAGRTQKAYEVIVQRAASGSTWYRPWSSGKITGTATNFTIPDKVLVDSGATYNFTVRVWDTVDRENAPNDPPYVSVSQAATFIYDAAVAGVTNFAAAKDPAYPWVNLTWDRSTMPDRWDIYRDGKIIGSYEAPDLFTSGTSYLFQDRLAGPRVQHTWKVVAVVNSKGSSSNPTASATVVPRTVCLSSKSGANPVLIWNPDYDMELAESSTVWTPSGDGPPILLTQSEHGYQGTVAGVLAENPVSSLTAKQWETRFNNLKKNNGETLLLTIIDRAFECFIRNATIKPGIDGDGLRYDVKFEFYQTDWSEE